MTPNPGKAIVRTYHLDIGAVHFYEHMVVTEMKEGIFLDFDRSAALFELGKQFFGDTVPFVYISNRMHSYSIDPTAHFKSVALFPNLKGYATVVYDEMNRRVAELEQAFIKGKKARIFTNLGEALRWSETLIHKD